MSNLIPSNKGPQLNIILLIITNSNNLIIIINQLVRYQIFVLPINYRIESLLVSDIYAFWDAINLAEFNGIAPWAKILNCLC